jgi:RNA-directed DNA polymerase
MKDKLTFANINHGTSGEGGTESAALEVSQVFPAPDKQRALAVCLMEEVCSDKNLQRALKRVKKNKGAPGIDGMTVDELPLWLSKHKEKLVGSLMNGHYRPQAVLEVKIPKAAGMRLLGIPTVVDRLIQQAILQIIEPILDPTFSPSSFGFRPGKSAHQAIKQAAEFVKDGYDIVVDIDIEAYFDNVNHDILMSRLARHVKDKRILKVVRKFLQAGIMKEGVCTDREKGTPQGSPLSPCLANLLLDDLDKELERRGHKFCRYADDCNTYVQSETAGRRVMESITKFLEKKLRLKVNKKKSGVDNVQKRQFLGYRILHTGLLGIAPKSVSRVKVKIRKLTERNRGRALQTVITELNIALNGWLVYFKYAQMKKRLRQLDSWTRRRLRCYRIKQRKRAYPIAKLLIAMGVPPKRAWSSAKTSKGWWRISRTPAVHEALNNDWFDKIRLINLSRKHASLKT